MVLHDECVSVCVHVVLLKTKGQRHLDLEGLTSPQMCVFSAKALLFLFEVVVDADADAGGLTLRESVEQIAHHGEGSHLHVAAAQPPACKQKDVVLNYSVNGTTD